MVAVGGVIASGFVINPPNIVKVVTFFGRYLGTVRRNGLTWTVPLTAREQVSLRIQNFDSEILKVNDANGNPVEVAAVIVWRVVDTAQAVFDVEDYEDFVRIQTETAVASHGLGVSLRRYTEEGQHSLRGHADEVTTSSHGGWPGLADLFRPDVEILLARTGEDVVRVIRDTPESRRQAIARAARERVLAEHSSAARAAELDNLLHMAAERRSGGQRAAG